MSGRASAIWKLLTSLAILLGVGLQLTDTPGRGPDWSTFAYFTTLSNLLVLSWALPAALRLWRGREAGAADSVWRGMAVMGVAITFLVANCLLDGVRNQAGEIRFSLFLLHELTPLMTAADWLVFDPRGWMRRRDIPAWAAFPCGYTAVVLAAQALGGPSLYPFLNMAERGTAQMVWTLAALLAALVLLGLGLCALDRRPDCPKTGKTDRRWLVRVGRTTGGNKD